jgi:hypothetical protein
MLYLPDVNEAVQQIRAAFDAVAEQHQQQNIRNPDWFGQIVRRIALWAKAKGMESCARGTPEGCGATEFLFDYCARIYDPEVPSDERFFAQTVIVGEIEWSQNEEQINKDFDKLLVSDALICFMGLQQSTVEKAEEMLEYLGRAARRRQSYALQRGVRPPPTFVFSCFVSASEKFVHKTIEPDPI